MAYQVIARKYRPQRFSDVVGQEHVTQTLGQAIAQNRIAHAYIFCGPRGTGKTTIARIFAKCLNCTGGPNVDFDEADNKCVEIAEGRSIDVLEIDGASNNGVDQVRELRETVKYAPASSKFKIYIIDEVHMLSAAAFNALLKTLEEPPAHVKFMFATTDPEKVLPTILSRCQRFDLRRIPVALIVKQLKHIAQQEKVEVEDAALFAIARGCDGGMRDAESALDQLISFCGDKIVENDVLSMYGLAAQSQILALSEAVIQGDAAAALAELDTLARNGKDLGRLLGDLLRHFRNLLIYLVARGDLSLVEASELEATSLAAQAKQLSSEAITRIMDLLSQCETNLRDAASKKILIEVAVLKCAQARHTANLDAVLKQLQQLRAEGGGPSLGNGPAAPAAPAAAPAAPKSPAPAPAPARAASTAPAAPAPPAPAPAAPAPVAPAPAPAPAVAKAAPVAAHPAPAPHQPAQLGRSATWDELVALWPQLVESAGRVSSFLRTYLCEAHPVKMEQGTLTIGFDPEFKEHIALVDNVKNHTLLQTKLHELGLGKTFIKFVVAEEPAGWQRLSLAAMSAPATAATASAAGAQEKPKPAPFDPATFKNDPLIQKALEVFKGTLVQP